MKKCIKLIGLSLWATITVISASSCNEKYDDSDLRAAISALENRVNATEQILKAYKNNLFIDNVVQTADGYVITFSDKSQVTIVNDKPIEFPEDKDTCYIDHIDVTDTHVVFYLSDGTSFSIGIACAISIEFDLPSTELTMIPGQERIIEFSVGSQIQPVEAEVLASGDVKAQLLSFDSTTGRGSLQILSTGNPDAYSKVVLIAANDRRITMKRLDFTPDGIDVYDNAQQPVTTQGGDIDLGFVSSVENVEVEIPAEAASWVHLINESRAAEYKHITIHVEPNNGARREAYITIRESGGTRYIVFHIKQEPRPGEAETTEREALLTVLSTLDIAHYPDIEYLNSQPVSNWPGITVDDEGHITEIDIQLCASGSLNPAIGQLRHLRKIRFHTLNISSIPDEFGMLKNLEHIEFGAMYRSEDCLTGSLPSCITSLPKLRYLDIHNHSLTSVGSNISKLTNLETLNLNGNDLHSVKFNAICQLTNLKVLDLMINYNLTGKIPAEISNLKKLETFNVSYCNLSGSVPPSIWDLSSLKVLEINGNNFDPIELPSSIKRMKNLETLSIQKVIGSLPSDIGECHNLKAIIMDFAGISGELPASLAELTNLETLSLPGNKLEGSIPPGLSKLPKLTCLQLSSNNLTGCITEDYSSIGTVWLYNNNLTGKIPQAMIDNRDFWRENWGKIYYGNQFDPIEVNWDGPHLVDYIDVAQTEPFYYVEEYPKNEYTIIFQWTDRCPYLDDCLTMIKEIDAKFASKGVKIIGRTWSECQPAIKQLGMTWPTYFTPQTDYPTYVVPTLSLVDRNGHLVFTDLIQDRFTLPDFLEARFKE